MGLSVSDDNKNVALSVFDENNSQKTIVIMNTEGNILKKITEKDIFKENAGDSLSFDGWYNNNLWVEESGYAGYLLGIASINLSDFSVKSYDITGIKRGDGRQRSLNMEKELIATSTYPFTGGAVGDDESFEKTGQEVYLYVYDLNTSSQILIAKSSATAFNPEWVGGYVLEYNDPSSNDGKRIRKSISLDEATKIIQYIPKDFPSEIKEGRCWVNSIPVQRTDAWRCMVGNIIYDPCFVVNGKENLVCDSYPNSNSGAFSLKLTEPLPNITYGSEENWAWIIELADGSSCSPINGASGSIGGSRINYECSDGSVIVGDLNVGTIWKANKVVLSENKTVLSSKSISIKTVWQ